MVVDQRWQQKGNERLKRKQVIQMSGFNSCESFVYLHGKRGSVNNDGLRLLSETKKRISEVSDDNHESAFLFQHLSVLV